MKELLAQLLYYPFINLLTFFIWAVPGHYAAVGIILITLVVRLVLIVPSRKAAEGQRRMNELQPLLEELKAEYGEDRNALGAAQMELYKKNGVNPFSSCGLALFQFPILYILYFTILHGLTLHNPHIYSWLPQPDSINSSFFGINLLNPDPTYILPILAAGLQFVQTRMTLPPKPKNGTTDPAVAMQQNILYVFPLVTLYIAHRFPAGVVLYWVITTLFSIWQQSAVNKKRLALVGVDAVVTKAENAHPERIREMEKAKKEVLATSTTKGGVSVTVRKKSK